MDHGSENIVDSLLADVRSGFASRRSGDSNFKFTKVKKVTLDTNENITTNPDAKSGNPDEFVRQGYGRKSLRRRKSERQDDNCDSESTCSSLEDAMETDRKRVLQSSSHDTLLDILSQSDAKSTEPQFERYPSLRKRRQERRDKRNVHGVFDDRERAASPALDASLNMMNSSLPRRSKTPSFERPKSDDMTEKSSRSVRRVKSMYEKREMDKEIANQKEPENIHKSDDSDDMVERLKRKLQRKETKSPDITTQRRDNLADNSVSEDSRTTRWRSGIATDLQTIDEKSKLESPSTKMFDTPAKNSREEMERRVSRHNFDPSELQKMLAKVDNAVPGHSNEKEDPRVSVSVRKQINHRWKSDLGKSDIDKVLKTIEDREKQDYTEQLCTQDDSCIDIPKSDPRFEETLQARRNKRKQRSTLLYDDVHAALRNNRTEDQDGSSGQLHTTVVTAQNMSSERDSSPPPSVPPHSHNHKDGNDVDSSPTQKPNMSKAAKLAARRKFNHKRFGDKDKPASTSGDSRCKSDVQKEEVDQALRDLKTGMSRSKSYDESVARKTCNDGTSDVIVNGDISPSQRKSFRGSVGRLGSDGRRNGVYIPSSDSDSEVHPDGTSSPKRPSSNKSDSPKSSSRLSIKSTGTSTETLRCDTPFSDNESPQQKRKNSTSKSQDLLDRDDIQKPISKNFDQPIVPPRSSRRAVSLVETHEITNAVANYGSRNSDETDMSPMAIMSQWKNKRKLNRRQSFYDNVQENEGSTSPRNKHHPDIHESNMSTSPRINKGYLINHKSEGSGDSLRNDIGSRCSYASSSDSARDEGFETMSGTVSQRTSMSSTLESEFTPIMSRKITEIKAVQSEKSSCIEDFRPPTQEIVVARVGKQTELNMRKQRTESWTEQVVATTTNIDKDSSLDSSIEYPLASPDSGHGTFKEDTWNETIDLESTLRVGSPISSVGSPRSPTSKTPQAPIATAEKTYDITGKKTSVPSYMRGTASSSKKKDNLSAASSTETNKRKNTTTSRLSNLNRTKTDSNNSLTSSISEASSKVTTKTSNRRTSSGVGSTPNSRSTTPHPVSRSTTPHPVSRSTTPHPVSRPTTPHVPSTTIKVKGTTTHSPKSGITSPPPRSGFPSPTTRSGIASPTPTSGFKRTQSLRLPNKSRTSLGENSSETTSPAGSRPSSASSRSSSRGGFMAATASATAKTRIDGATSPTPIPPPRTTSVSSGRTTTTSTKKTPAPSPKSTPAPSPLTRHGSLRLPARSASKLVYADAPISEKDKTQSDGKVKPLRSKIGGNKVNPESPTKLATVPEQESAQAQEKEKSGSSIKRIVNKTKDKILAKKTTDATKRESLDKKKGAKK